MKQQIKAIYRRIPLIILLMVLLVSTIVLIQLVFFHSKINSGFFTWNAEVKDLKIANCISEYTPSFVWYGPDDYTIDEMDAEELAGDFCRDRTKRPPLFIKIQ
ncbi:MAG: hypothetical protein V1756_00225 [Patescibacteria group bacterium]